MARTLALLRAAGWDARPFTRADLPDQRLSPLRYLNNRVARRALRRALAEFQPDVVHLHNYYHLLSPGVLVDLDRYKAAAGARVVMTAHDYHLVCPNSGATWYRGVEPVPADLDRLRSCCYLLGHRWDRRGRPHSALKLLQHVWHYRRTDRRTVIDLILCPSRFMQAAVARLGRPTVWLPNPNPPALPAKVKRPDELTFVFAGRVEPEKGLVRFLELLPHDFGDRLLVVGDGLERPTAQRVVTRRGLGDQVAFLGRRPHSETLGIIAAAHVLVLPSRWDENYPLSLIEALAVGTNLLLADRGGMREIVEDAGVGYRFAPDDAAGLADRLQTIRAAHAAGALNGFDATAFLAGRDEAAYLDGVVQAYEGRAG